jgi:orotate phosphoribosyltransferase
MNPDGWDMESKQIALETCRALLRTGALCYDSDRPFNGGGLVSPVHIDCRRLMSFPALRSRIVDFAVRTIEHEIGEGTIRLLAASEGAGLSFATLIADRLDLPLAYVRKTSPDDPHKRQVEGVVEPGQRTLLIEQIATDGHRKARFVKPLREAGADVRDALVIFGYGIFDTISENLAPLGITLHPLANWWDLVEIAGYDHSLDERILHEAKAFLEDPGRWQFSTPSAAGSDRSHRRR